VGLLGSPALTRNRLERAPRRTAVGTTLTIVAPLGQYDSGQLVNLGYNRWAFKPEIGITQPAGGFVLECYAGSWLFTTNHEYFPGRAQRRQEPIVSVQGHIGYSLASRAWLALDGTWFEGGTTEVDGRSSPDRQDNVRLGGTLSVSVMKGHSIKLIYSSGAHTLRGTDYDTFTLTWQIVRLGT
jgi:hypothetical protein